MNIDDYHNAEIGRIGADRMSLGLPIIPCKKYGDMEKVREITEQRDEWEAKYSKEATDNMLAINKIAGERDRLAEVLEQIANTDLHKCDDECAKLMYIASIHNAKQVLQSLTNQPTEP